MISITLGSIGLVTHVTEFDELLQRLIKKPADPYTLAFTLVSNAIHPVVPITSSHQRQPVSAHGETSIQSSRTMFKQCGGLRRSNGLSVGFGLFGFERGCFQKSNSLIEHRTIACYLDVASCY